MLKSRRRFLQGTSATAALLFTPWTLRAVFFAPNAPHAESAAPPVFEQTRLLMDTLVTISTPRPTNQRVAEAVEAAFSEATRLEAILTRHAPTAPLDLLNQQNIIRDVPPELRRLLTLALHISAATKNAFNPLAVTLAEAKRQGIHGNEMKRLETLAEPKALRLDDTGLRLESAELLCSLDGIAKGFIVDAISSVLCRHQVFNHLINAGGDIFAGGSPGNQHSWNLGILNAEGEIARMIPLRDMALATSGNSESLARGYEHILPVPCSEAKVRRPFSASAVAPNATLADAYSTALFALDPQRAESTAARAGVGFIAVTA